jgi:hypothetical protein
VGSEKHTTFSNYKPRWVARGKSSAISGAATGQICQLLALLLNVAASDVLGYSEYLGAEASCMYCCY